MCASLLPNGTPTTVCPALRTAVTWDVGGISLLRDKIQRQIVRTHTPHSQAALRNPRGACLSLKVHSVVIDKQFDSEFRPSCRIDDDFYAGCWTSHGIARPETHAEGIECLPGNQHDRNCFTKPYYTPFITLRIRRTHDRQSRQNRRVGTGPISRRRFHFGGAGRNRQRRSREVAESEE